MLLLYCAAGLICTTVSAGNPHSGPVLEEPSPGLSIPWEINTWLENTQHLPWADLLSQLISSVISRAHKTLMSFWRKWKDHLHNETEIRLAFCQPNICIAWWSKVAVIMFSRDELAIFCCWTEYLREQREGVSGSQSEGFESSGQLAPLLWGWGKVADQGSRARARGCWLHGTESKDGRVPTHLSKTWHSGNPYLY